MLSIGIIIILSYFAGSIPTSIIAGKLLKGFDIRDHGSGNAGATNVFRVLGWKAGVVVSLIDLSKGFISVVFLSRLSLGEVPVDPEIVKIIAGISAVIGHIWTVFARFKGGKGVLTVVGMYFGLAPLTMILCIAAAGLSFFATRYVSVASLTGAISLAVIMTARKYWLLESIGLPLFVFSMLLSLLLVYTHRSNIKRLIEGNENKIAKK